MVVAEILTGIALVQKSVDFIKSNISTANDIKDIAKQIDGFFLGEEQMNKTQGKGMSIAEQFGSVESSASEISRETSATKSRSTPPSRSMKI